MTEACNYQCSYCYAHWTKPESGRDVMHNADLTQRLLSQLFAFFSQNPSNPLRAEMQWDSVRLNLAGGEPLLNQKRTLAIVAMAKAIGFDVSIITNASRLDAPTLSALAPLTSMIGISLDSANTTTMREIGRKDSKGRMLNLETLSSSLREARLAHPALRLKVNTVVNQLNCDEDMTALVKSFAPDKWKVLRMLPVLTNQLEVTDSQFAAFLARHQAHDTVISAEDNDSLTESYIMVDPKGRFFQNSIALGAAGYHYSRSIVEAGADAAFSDLTFSARKYLSRYSQTRAHEMQETLV
jgi:radical S-adenosyl methionine domain-containing protein 2